jgi:putative ABC transport system permease protein
MRFDDVKESALMAFDTLRANKLRSSLTILGVSVGVVTVIFMVSIIQGLNKAFAEQIEALGSNTIFVSKFDPSFGRPPGPEERQRKELTVADADALRPLPTVSGVAAIHRKIATLARYQDKQTDTPVLFGVTPAYEFVVSAYVGRGRFVNELDLEGRDNVCVLGLDAVKALFPYEDPLGKEIKIDGNPYRVIGVMEKLGEFFGQSRDNSIFIPITTFDKYHPGEQPVPQVAFFIIVRPASRAVVKQTMEDIRDILRRRRQVPYDAKDNFGMSSQDALMDIYNQLTGATFLVLTAVSAVALMIGGIGVMNIMLVSVTERTKEIGIRKAVGATRFNILAQFLIEAVVLTAVGGVAGLVVGEIASLVVNKYSPLPAYVPPWAIAVGLGVSASVGIVFGLWPAWKAARLDPIEALRYE